MKRLILQQVIACFSLFSIIASLSNAYANDAAIYGALPTADAVQISPDGKTAAVLHNIDGTAAVFFYDLDTPGSQPTGISVGAANARDLIWADNEYALLRISQSDRVETSSGLKTLEFYRWMSISKSKQKAVILLKNESGFYLPDAGDIVSTLPQKPGKALFSRLSSKSGAPQLSTVTRFQEKHEFVYPLFEVDLKTGRDKRIEIGEPETVSWIVDGEGAPYARIDDDYKEGERRVYLRNASGDLALKSTYELIEGRGSWIGFHGRLPNSQNIAATAYNGGGTRRLLEYDVQTAEAGRVIFNNEKHDIDYSIYNPTTAEIEAVVYTTDLPKTYYLTETKRSLQKALEGALPNAAIAIASSSADNSRHIVEATYPDHPRQFFLFDNTKKTLDVIFSAYPALDGKVFAHKERFDYRTSDGKEITGYLTVPKNAQKQSRPLIVMPHGGPESRADQAWDYWSFFYAARGYLVYEPNFRGSTGFGLEFREAGYGEWGRKMQDDITGGVQKLIADGIADPDRICIVGASYGGYAALAGATLTPDLYACAVSVNGVSNLTGMLGHELDSSGAIAEDYWKVRIGHRYRDAEALKAVSPVEIASKAGAPILLIYSKDDVVVPSWQSTTMRDALKTAGKPHEYMELDGEDHWLSSSATRTEMLTKSIEFIDKYIGR